MSPAIAAGACVALMGRFEAEAALDVMCRTGTTVLLGVPTMCIALLQAAGGASEAAAAAGRARRAAHRWRRTRCARSRPGSAASSLEGYGMTETAGTVATHRVGQPCKPGSVGTPADGMELRLLDEGGAEVARGEIGEVVLRGPGLMKGYWRNPAETGEAIREEVVRDRATWATWTRTATSSSSIARRT